MEIQKIKIKGDYKLADMIHDIEKGILRIPQFQREFVWDKARVIKLLESIYNEYPIGSFFFWDAPQHYHNFYRDIAELNLPKPDRYDKIIFILDGQQRITSLYVTVKGLKLYGRNYRDICFDLDEKAFVDRKPDNERYISINDLLSDDKPDIYDELTTERKLAYKDCYRRFINYPFSAIDVRDKELDEVCDIFERINQGGQRLNLFDLISASTWTPDFDLRVAVKKENEQLKIKGFGEIDNEVFIQALALISHGSCTRVVQLQLRSDDVKDYWQHTIENVGLAIDYIRGNYGVVNSSFVPYRSMIAVIAYLFYKNNSRSLDNKQAEALAQWFWQVTFSERYSASILTLMTEDKKVMDKIAEGKDMAIRYPFNLDIDSMIKIRMYRKSAIKNGVLCLLARKNPRHFKNNSPLLLRDVYYSDFNNSEKHHIFPKSIVQKSYPIVMIHSLPNFCFIPAELNKEISNKKPSTYFAEFSSENSDFGETLKTHLIRYDDAVKNDDFTSFLAARAAMMLEEITRATGSKIGKVIADNVNKAIDDIENKLRDCLDSKLVKKNPDYWKQLVPSDIVGVVRKRIAEYLDKDPTKTTNDLKPRDLLDFCDVMDYAKIILTNWDEFGSVFRSKYEVEKRFLSLKEYRNAVKHGRGEIVPFIQKEGEAALEWLSAVLEGQQKVGIERKSESETEEETRLRVKNEFVKSLIKEVPLWVEKTLDDSRVKVTSGFGSNHYLKHDGKVVIFYYYATNWLYIELQKSTEEERRQLKGGLSKPESVVERKYQGQVRFHVMTENDWNLAKEIVQKRIA